MDECGAEIVRRSCEEIAQIISLTLRQVALYTKFIQKRKEKGMDDEWVALVTEARSLGLTMEEIREWLEKMKAEAVINE